MKSSWGSAFPCPHCGSHNLTGAGFCGNCGTNLYYNCPDCRGWVNVTFSNCPNCRVKLDWPVAGALAGRPSSPAVVLLILGIAMLITGSIYLVVNNPGSVSAVSNKSTSQPSSNPYTNTLTAEDNPQPSITYQNSPALNGSADFSGYSYYDPGLATTPDTASYEVIITIPATAPSDTTGTVSPPNRSYLDTVYPTWGRCVNGRCSK